MLKRISEVFTKEYSDRVKTQIFLEKHIKQMKFRNKSESMDDKIERLKKAGTTPVFRIKLSPCVYLGGNAGKESRAGGAEKTDI